MIAFLRNVLQIRQGEERTVGLLILLFMLPAFGGGVGTPGIMALFFTRFGTEYLPQMYIILGLLTVVASAVITVLVGKVRPSRLYTWLPLLLGVLFIPAWLSLGSGFNLLYPLLWLYSWLLWTLQDLFSWGMAGLALNTRQAKRLFSLLGAAYILGSVLGGLGARALVGLLGSGNLILVWAAALIASFGVAALLKPANKEQEAGQAQPINPIKELRGGFNTVKNSLMLRNIAGMMLLLSILYFALDAPFSRAMAIQFPDEDTLSGFLGVFQGVTTTVAFLTSLFLANRLYALFGYNSALLGFPLIYLIGFTGVFFFPRFELFVGFRFSQLVWMQAVFNPAYQAMYNVLPDEDRDRARTFIDGIPRQIGTSLAGVLLLVQAVLSAGAIMVVELAVALGAAILIWPLHKAYLQSLRHALQAGWSAIFYSKEKPFGGFPFDAEAVRITLRSMEDPDSSVRFMAAQVLGRQPAEKAVPALTRAVFDHDARVRIAALRSLTRLGAQQAMMEVIHCLYDPEPAVRVWALRSLYKLATHGPAFESSLKRMLDDPDAEVRAWAAVLLYRIAASPEDRSSAEARLEALLAPDQPHALPLAVLGALEEAPITEMKPLIAAYLAHPDAALRRAAVAAAARLPASEALPLLADSLADTTQIVRQKAIEGFQAIGEEGVPHLLAALNDERRQQAALRALQIIEFTDHAPILEFISQKADDALHYHQLRQAVQRLLPGSRADLLRRVLAELAERRAGAAIEAVGILDPDVKVDCLRASFLDAQEAKHAYALEILDNLPFRDRLRPLLSMWETHEEDEDNDGLFQGTLTVETLTTALEDKEPWVRTAAAWAVQEAYSPALKPALLHMAAADPFPLARDIAAETLRLLEGGTRMKTLTTLTTIERVMLLEKTELFKGLPIEDLQSIAETTEEHTFSPGQVLTPQGHLCDRMFIIVSGEISVEVTPADSDLPIEVARHEAGECLGEIELISNEPRMASLVAATESRVLIIKEHSFEAILEERPSLALRVIHSLGSRLREIYEVHSASQVGVQSPGLPLAFSGVGSLPQPEGAQVKPLG